MIKVDLITGFLGSGKTTFLKRYAQYYINKGMHIGILENDHGAVNVDMMMLQELEGDNCDLEMVSGGCDYDCHYRRFKTKLIAMGMYGLDRVIIEPSGIFNVNEFYDILREEPLDRWYEIGSVITIVDSTLSPDLISPNDEYLLASQVASAGAIVFSKLKDSADINQAAVVQNTEKKTTGEHSTIKITADDTITNTLSYLEESLAKIKCTNRLTSIHIAKPWSQLNGDDFELLARCGYHPADYISNECAKDPDYESIYIMESGISYNKLVDIIPTFFSDASFGKIIRIKGFIHDLTWQQINFTQNNADIQPVQNGQDVIIIIGYNLNEEKIQKTLGIN